jgi:hypothetical protein
MNKEKLTIKEKFGVTDRARIFEGLHLTDGFIRSMALRKDTVEPEFLVEGERHFGICEECKNKRDSFLPLEEK